MSEFVQLLHKIITEILMKIGEKKLRLCSYPTILIYINICDFNKKQLTNRCRLVYYYIVIV